MTTQEILNKWLEYTKFDENQNSFNLMSANFYMHQCVRKMQKVMDFDHTGTLAVLYAKGAFTKLCKDVKVSLYDYFEDTGNYKEDLEMWNIFQSDDIRNIEQGLLSKIDNLVQQVVPAKMLGNRDTKAEADALLSGIEVVVENLSSCRNELFCKGGSIMPITYFSTHIHVFSTMARCLIAMESCDVRDGIYLCFIQNRDSADCFFTFMLKSNGNLLSVNERIAEKYPGQHKNWRNGRWGEDKKYALFPYKYIVECDEYDYLGYAHSQVIDTEKLAFFNLGAPVYIPLLLAMVCISNKYTNFDTSEMPLYLVDALLPWNLALPAAENEEAIIVPKDDIIVENHKAYERNLSTELVASGGLHEHFSHKNREAGQPGGVFPNTENIFVKLYSSGFVLDSERLLVADSHLFLKGEGSGDKEADNEFIATSEGMDLIAYMQGRKQLASYIRERMWAEYISFGGQDAIEDWLKDAFEKNRERIFRLCVEKYKSLKTTAEDSTDICNNPINCYSPFMMQCSGKPLSYIAYGEEKAYKKYHLNFCASHPYNKEELHQGNKVFCPNTGTQCSIGFVFRPRTWHDLEEIFGELPKPLIGWIRDGHYEEGNTILDVTDAVTGVGTVFEFHEQQVYLKDKLDTRNGWHDDSSKKTSRVPAPRTTFNFSVEFSKRGFSSEVKKCESDLTL